MAALASPRDEAGFTLVELLVVTALGVAVLIAGTNVLMASVRGEEHARERSGQIQDARFMVERVSRELREGYGVEVADPSHLVLLTYVQHTSCGGGPATESIACRVEYVCDAGTCTRTETDPDSGSVGSTSQVVHGITSDEIFTYSPTASEPNYIGVELELPAEEPGEDAVTLSDGVALRNTAFGV